MDTIDVDDDRSKILDEYVKVCKTIDKIKYNIHLCTIDTDEKLRNTSSKKNRKRIVMEYKTFIDTIKNDSDIIKKYKLLKQRQNMLRNQLTKKIVASDLSTLYLKYDANIGIGDDINDTHDRTFKYKIFVPRRDLGSIRYELQDAINSARNEVFSFQQILNS
jgi:hypothetical protein